MALSGRMRWRRVIELVVGLAAAALAVRVLFDGSDELFTAADILTSVSRESQNRYHDYPAPASVLDCSDRVHDRTCSLGGLLGPRSGASATSDISSCAAVLPLARDIVHDQGTLTLAGHYALLVLRVRHPSIDRILVTDQLPPGLDRRIIHFNILKVAGEQADTAVVPMIVLT